MYSLLPESFPRNSKRKFAYGCMFKHEWKILKLLHIADSVSGVWYVKSEAPKQTECSDTASKSFAYWDLRKILTECGTANRIMSEMKICPSQATPELFLQSILVWGVWSWYEPCLYIKRQYTKRLYFSYIYIWYSCLLENLLTPGPYSNHFRGT
jgi:hypothetical protein